MKPYTLLFILLSSLGMTACNPVSYDVRYDNVNFDSVKKRTVVSAIDSGDQEKIDELTRAIIKLGPGIDPDEARFVAREAVLFPKHLANRYRLVGPPNFQNVLVNSGKRDRGLCYHWAQDMTAHIASREYRTLTLQRAVANQGKFVEHNVLTVAARGKGIKDAIILDGWRHSGTLLWMKTRDDPDYDWVKYYPVVKEPTEQISSIETTREAPAVE